MSSDVVSKAEGIINQLSKNQRGNLHLTTSQIRKFLAAVNGIKNRVEVWKSRMLIEGKEPKNLPPDIFNEIKFLKVKLLYQYNRERAVREFIDKSNLLQEIDQVGIEVKKFEEFARLVEAMVAYHKYHGGRD